MTPVECRFDSDLDLLDTLFFFEIVSFLPLVTITDGNDSHGHSKRVLAY